MRLMAWQHTLSTLGVCLGGAAMSVALEMRVFISTLKSHGPRRNVGPCFPQESERYNR
jgi:hypothetical protein